MDGVGFFQLAAVIFIGAALREVIAVFPVQLGKLLQRIVAVMEFIAGNFLEQAARTIS